MEETGNKEMVDFNAVTLIIICKWPKHINKKKEILRLDKRLYMLSTRSLI